MPVNTAQLWLARAFLSDNYEATVGQPHLTGVGNRLSDAIDHLDQAFEFLHANPTHPEDGETYDR